jgi:small subunit ribosomal protein S20
MANHASAKKRIRQTVQRAAVNRNRIGRIRTFVKKVEVAIAAGDATGAKEAFKVAEPMMMRGAQIGVQHRKTASRKVSRLSARIKSMEA